MTSLVAGTGDFTIKNLYRFDFEFPVFPEVRWPLGIDFEPDLG